MKEYQIPQTDLSVSRLAYGTWHIGGSWDTTPPSADIKERAVKLIDAAVEHGINHIDAVILTHDHADACMGLDDLREFQKDV